MDSRLGPYRTNRVWIYIKMPNLLDEKERELNVRFCIKNNLDGIF